MDTIVARNTYDIKVDVPYTFADHARSANGEHLPIFHVVRSFEAQAQPLAVCHLAQAEDD